MSNMREQDRDEYRKILDEILLDYCPDGRYCILKEFLVASHPSRRLLFQLKACDKFKLERSSKEDKDIGWEETLRLWVEEGYAEKFAKVYDDKKSLKDIYRDTMHSGEKT